TISMSRSTARSSSITAPIEPSSLYAGTIATRLRAASCGSTVAGASCSVSAMDRRPRRHAEAEQPEQQPRAVHVRVLVERSLARRAAELVRAARVVEQLSIRIDRLVRAGDDEQLAPRLEPPLDALVRVRDDRGAGHGQLERPRRGRGRNGRV